MIKKFIALLGVILIMCQGIPVLASEVSEEQTVESVSEGDVSTYNVADTGSFWVNGKRYTCSTNFVWTKSSSTLYYGGMYSNTAASTKRNYSLAVKANTPANGYITYSGSGSNNGTGTLYQKKMITINRTLDTPNYKSFSGSCKIYYGSTLKWTGSIYG